MTQTILITGANRGLGLEFVNQYSQEDTQILACCRTPDNAPDLQNLAKKNKSISVYKLDTTSESDIEDLKHQITQPIDVLINNAGYLESDDFENITRKALTHTFLINSVAPLMILKAFRKQLASSQRKLAVSISSSMGSISDNTSGGYYSYRASKAALNMLMKSAAIDLAQDNIKVLVLHPGWVKTRMGGENALITPEESIKGMRKVIENYNPAPGDLKYIRYDGGVLAW